MIRAVFFDTYGTLAGFEPSRHELQSEACADFGIEVTPEGIVKGYAAADTYMNEQNSLSPVRLRIPEKRDEFFAEYERLVLYGCGVEVPREKALEIFRRLRQIPYELARFDDVVPALKQLRGRGITVGVITKADRLTGAGQRSARRDHEQHLAPPALLTSSKTRTGIDSVWAAIRGLL